MTDAPSMVPLYQKFMDNTDWRILIYSGDVDSVLPTLGTQEWINTMDMPIKKGWKVWKSKGELGGYVQEYEQLTFLTIHGAGHMVPYFRPGPAFTFFEKFIHRGEF
jgi:serine carboxypeptidase-like clade 2